MKKIAVLCKDGFEEIEALTPVDVLRRANVHVDLVGDKFSSNYNSNGLRL